MVNEREDQISLRIEFNNIATDLCDRRQAATSLVITYEGDADPAVTRVVRPLRTVGTRAEGTAAATVAFCAGAFIARVAGAPATISAPAPRSLVGSVHSTAASTKATSPTMNRGIGPMILRTASAPV